MEKRKGIAELLGPVWRQEETVLGNGDGDIALRIAFLILTVLPNTIEHPSMLIDQHGKTGKGIIESLSSLCETCDYISLLRPLSHPDLEACQTKPRIGLHSTSNIGIP